MESMIEQLVNTEYPIVSTLDDGGPRPRFFKPFTAEALEYPLIGQFLAIATWFSERLAVQDHRQALSYGVLRTQVERTVAGLQTLLPDAPAEPAPIALYFDHDTDYVVAILAALWLGHPYVPLDPAFPDERNARILTHSGASQVLTAPGYLDRLARLAPELTCLDYATLASAPVDQLPDPAPVDRLAYILYTSGSTGIPKGVYQNQQGVLHDVGQYINSIHLNPEDRLSLLYSLSVLGSLRDLLGALLTGASAHLFAVAREGITALPTFLRDRRISVYHSLPTIFRRLTDTLPNAACLGTVRLVYLAGDRIDHDDVQRYRQHFTPSCLLYVGIGATECSTLYCQWFINHHTPLDSNRLPVGRRIPDRFVRLETPDGAIAALGEVGEIVVSSRYLALGYWRDPELTATRFSVDPDDPQRRCFRTGDLGRFRTDGLLEFHGRCDQRVKIGGHLIDPGLVEAALQAQTTLKEAAVVVAAHDTPQPRLLAALVPQEGQTLEVEALHATLTETFPAAALPVTYRLLDRLPQTPNGKLDRNALIAQLTEHTGAGEPRTPLEQRLCEIWRTVLPQHDHIGIHDHFFATLGGDSIEAVRLIRAVEQQLGRRLPPMTLFRLATIADMAQAIETAPIRPRHPAVVDLQPLGLRPPLFFAPSLGGGPGNIRNLTRYLNADQPLFGLRELDKPSPCPYAQSMETLAAECITALRAVQPEAPYYLAGFSFGGRVAFAMAQQLQQQGQPVAFLAIIDASARLFRQPNRLKHIYDPHHRPTTYRFLSERYVPAPFAGDIIYFQAAQRWEAALLEPDGGWGAVTHGQTQVHSLPGRHLDLMKEPGVAALASAFDMVLQAAQTRPNRLICHNEDVGARQRFLAKQAEIAGELGDEIMHYQQALAINAEQPLYVLTNLWEALHLAGRSEDGRAIYEQTFEQFDNDIAFHYRAGQSLRGYGELRDSQRHFERAFALGCRSPALFFEWGILEQRQGRLETAIERFEQTLAHEPNHLGALRRIADVLRRVGREGESAAYTERAVALQPAKPNNP
jgi:amino acid adenylation domain-containing protein